MPVQLGVEQGVVGPHQRVADHLVLAAAEGGEAEVVGERGEEFRV